MYGQPGFGGDVPKWVPPGVVQRLHADPVGDLKSARHASLSHSLHLLNRGFNIVAWDACERSVTIRVGTPEIGQPFVVNPQHLRGCLVVIKPHAGAENAVEDFSLDTVA